MRTRRRSFTRLRGSGAGAGAGLMVRGEGSAGMPARRVRVGSVEGRRARRTRRMILKRRMLLGLVGTSFSQPLGR